MQLYKLFLKPLDIYKRFYSVEVSQALVARLTRVRFTVGPHHLLPFCRSADLSAIVTTIFFDYVELQVDCLYPETKTSAMKMAIDIATVHVGYIYLH